MRRALAIVATAATIGSFIACGTTDLIVGDDTAADSSPPLDASTSDSSPLPLDSGADAKSDAKPDAPTACAAPATCMPSSEPCMTLAAGSTCAAASEVCCAQTCPQLSPPAPTFCDGGPIAAQYNPSSKCIVGYACAPVACTAAGGQCVGLAPGACPNGHLGDATKYSCGGGVGSTCCLP
jgi:hypothetical protein